MKILVIGSGGREHALVWKLRQSPVVDRIYCAPGNGGIERMATCVPIAVQDIAALKSFAKEHTIDLTIVGPEEPLTLGLADAFRLEKLAVFGPSAAAAEIEGSKIFAKQLMKKYRIPTAEFEVFEQPADALNYVRKINFPCVVKADGLAAGKGVVVCDDGGQAEAAIENMMIRKAYGKAADRIIIEERLTGEELSVFVITDGTHFLMLPPARDHKRVFDGDRGKNTGGMGAYAPVPDIHASLLQMIEETIIFPVIEAMHREKRLYQGVLYAGLMLTTDGPKVIEFNCRFGDPECQALMPLLNTDLAEMTLAVCRGQLTSIRMMPSSLYSVCVVLASGGYPDAYEKGKIIHGLTADTENDSIVFHAGTQYENGVYVTNGGRVLGVTAWADNLPIAVEKAYHRIQTIHFEGMHYRRDIASRELRFKNEK